MGGDSPRMAGRGPSPGPGPVHSVALMAEAAAAAPAAPPPRLAGHGGKQEEAEGQPEDWSHLSCPLIAAGPATAA